METDDRYTRITLRIPRDLHGRLGERATATSKSLNAEIIERLTRSFDPPADEKARKKIEQLRHEIDALLVEQTKLRATIPILEAALSQAVDAYGVAVVEQAMAEGARTPGVARRLADTYNAGDIEGVGRAVAEIISAYQAGLKDRSSE
jgi:hypothetical protein